MTSGFGATPDQTMPAGPAISAPQAVNAPPGLAAFAATTQDDWQTQMRNALLNAAGLGQLVQLCNIINNLPIMQNLRNIGDTATNGATGSIFQAIGNLIDPLVTAIQDFVHAFDNIDWTNPLTIIPTLLRDAITACWNLFWAIVKWAIYVIDVITNLNALSGVTFLQGLGNYLDFPQLKTAFNTLLTTWESLDFAGSPLTALPAAFVAFVQFLKAIVRWALDVIEKILGLIFPGWFNWAALGDVWTQFRTSLQAINWSDIPTALTLFVAAAVAALQGTGNWILSVFTGLIGSSATVLHTMFAGPIAFVNQMILHFFGSTGLAKWQASLDFFTGLTNSTPIAALNAVYAQFQNLGTLFGNLTGGTLVSWLTTLFQHFSDNFAYLPTTLQGDLNSLFTAVGDLGQQVLDNLVNFFTGDSSTGHAITELIPAMQTWGSELLTNLMQNAMNAVNNISVSSLLPAGAQNLLLNPDFSTAVSLSDPSGGWTWDDTVFLTGIGVSSPGSAKVTATGILKALRSNTVTVTAGKVFNAAITVLTDGMVSTGTPLLLEAITEAGTTTLASSAAPTGSASGWTGATGTARSTTLSGSYTVPSSGVSTITLRLVVDTTATAGTVWWDGGNLAAQGLLHNALVDGIGGITDLGTTLQQTWDNVAGTVGADLAHIVTRLQNLNTLGIFNPNGIANIFAGGASLAADFQNTVDAWIKSFNGNTGAGFTPADILAKGQALMNNLFGSTTFTLPSSGATLNYPVLPAISIGALSTDIQSHLANLANNLFGSGSSTAATAIQYPALPVIVIGSVTTDIQSHLQTMVNNLTSSVGTGLGLPTTNMLDPHHKLWDAIVNGINGTTSTGNTPASVQTAIASLASSVNAYSNDITTYISASGSYSVPSWATKVDVIPLGGGGGGAYGSTINKGNGGNAGNFGGASNITGLASTTITITIGAGGAGGASTGASGSTGGTTTISYSGGSATGSGGTGGVGVATNPNGASPGSTTVNGKTYTGGGTQTSLGATGIAPGGGGGGGTIGITPYTGGTGGAGGAWIRAHT